LLLRAVLRARVRCGAAGRAVIDIFAPPGQRWQTRRTLLQQGMGRTDGLRTVT